MNPLQAKALREEITRTLKRCASGPLAPGATALLGALRYHSDKTLALSPNNFTEFQETFAEGKTFDAEKALAPLWQSVDLLFQYTDAEVRSSGQMALDVFADPRFNPGVYQSFVFFAIALTGDSYTRTQLAEATREINKLFQMPAIIVFRHGATLTLAVIERRLNKRDGTKDVLEKVTLIKDIRCDLPHRAHVEILSDLALDDLLERHSITNFDTLHTAWRKTLDTAALNKKFYKELADWYFWALNNITFPTQPGVTAEVNAATNAIRLITRLMFTWFLKERGLVPEDLFDDRKLASLLVDLSPNHSTYYKAILQNLFFATLNTEMDDPAHPRRFRGRNQSGGRDSHYGIPNVLRYDTSFHSTETALALFAPIPFLNGGLFECLDQTPPGGPRVLVDGFSDRDDNPLRVPNFLFFSEPRDVDLNAIYGTTNKTTKVRGLLNILHSYKFTVAENTPIEEEIALDPELLGRVFENLLASYNPETGATARKQTGSFYTPREIVNYMVDESLIASLETALAPPTPPSLGGKGAGGLGSDSGSPELGRGGISDLNTRLRHLFAYNTDAPDFTLSETDTLVNAIDSLKILDPACGSGAFPMGILQKLVFVLGKLDPQNAKWRDRQIAKAEQINEPAARDHAIADIEQAFDKNDLDYGRKLYLISNGIYGVDIQPIAMQIAKLRFFISLMIDQRIDDGAKNRGIRALPNLETKFVAANTLIGIDKAGQQTLPDQSILTKQDALRRVRERYFSARTPATKAKCKEEDKQLRAEISTLLESSGLPHDTALRLSGWDPYDQNQSAGFFDPAWMYGIEDGFDIVIGNPPYIKERTLKKAFEGLKASQYYQGKMDIWYFFGCKSLDFLQDRTGTLCFIATNNWVTNDGGSILRNKIVAEATITEVIDFGNFKIFENADIQTMILLCRKKHDEAIYSFDISKITNSDATAKDVVALLDKKLTANTEFLHPKFDRNLLRDRYLVFANDNHGMVLLKIQSQPHFLLQSHEVASGIDVLQDFVNKASREKLGCNFSVGDGIFVLSDDEKNRMSLTFLESNLLKPYFTPTDLQRYSGRKKNRYWIIYTDSSFKGSGRIQQFPNIKKHLDQYSLVMTSVNKPYGLHRSRDEKFFLGEKIFALRKCALPTFTYTDFPCYVARAFSIIKTDRFDLKYLTGLLNSRLVSFWLRHKGKMQGHQFQVDKEPLLTIPIVSPDAKSAAPVVKIVSEILQRKEINPDANTLAQEKQIDQLIYSIYQLTPDEIAIVEGQYIKSLDPVSDV